jgi:hypothetical protein
LADVFISYKRRMRTRVAELAATLERLKVSVWFDAEIEPGKSFGAVINRELADAKCVLVCWTPDAFAPEHGDDISWVEAEATMGRDRKVLVPVLFEQTILNAPWNMLQTENLMDWTPDAVPTGAWLGALAGIGKLVGRPGLADYARAIAANSPTDLTRWAQAYPDDPLTVEVWDKITELEVAAARERVTANRSAKPAPAPEPVRTAPPPRNEAQPQTAYAAQAAAPAARRKMSWWQLLVVLALFALGVVGLAFAALVTLAGTSYYAAMIFYLALGVPLLGLAWFLRRKWSRPA